MGSHDVVVVGAGLAGMSCALHLLHRRPETRVLVLERLGEPSYGRYHRICGEALSEAARREMRPLELSGRRHRVRYAEERWPDGTAIRARVDGHIIDRPAFLASLQKRFVAMGGSIRKDCMLSAERVDGGFLVHARGGDIRCRWLVGADGAFSRVRSSFFDESPGSLIPVKQFLVPGKMERDDSIVFHFQRRFDGAYLWEFPCGDMVNTGFPKGSQEPFLDVAEEGGRYIPIGALDQVVSGRCCLVGDAAAMVNPLSFGGIRIALLSGKKAAAHIAAGDLGGYQRWWRRSPFSRRDVYEAYLEVKDWSDEDMVEFIRPFRKGYTPLAFASAYVRWPSRRKVTSAFIHSFRYGW